MKHVLDSNVALKWVLRETDSDKIRQVRLDYHVHGGTVTVKFPRIPIPIKIPRKRIRRPIDIRPLSPR
jgi:hypothetical protein